MNLRNYFIQLGGNEQITAILKSKLKKEGYTTKKQAFDIQDAIEVLFPDVEVKVISKQVRINPNARVITRKKKKLVN